MAKGIKHYARTRVITTGEIARVNVYPVRKVPGARGVKCQVSRDCQRELNRRNSKKRFSDIAHLNFSRQTGGYRVSLDYNFFIDEHGRNPDAKEYKAYLSAYLRAMRSLYAAAGGEFKYMVMTHIGRRAGKVHHHLIISAPPSAIEWSRIKDAWVCGYDNYDPLRFRNGSIAGLTAYFFDNSVDFKWSCSKNCKRPSESEYADGTPASVEVKDGFITMADAHYIDKHPEDVAFASKFFPGYVISHIRITPEYMVDTNGDVYTLPFFGGPFLEIEMFKASAADKRVKLKTHRGRVKPRVIAR